MKTCPSCRRTYQDDSMRFCLDDGTSLVQAADRSVDPQATLIMPDLRPTDPGLTAAGPTIQDRTPATAISQKPYPEPTQSSPQPGRRSALPWILVAAVVLGISGIVIALIIVLGLKPGAQTAQTGPPTSPTASPSPTQSEEEISHAEPSSSPTPTVFTPPVNRNSLEPTETNKSGEAKPTPKPTPKAANTPAAKPTATPKEEQAAPKRPLSGGLLNGKAISLPKPAYPAVARQAHASGQVAVQVLVDEEGNVISAHAISGHPLLQASAVSAARAAKFTPTKLSGQPVKVTGVIIYNFVAQ